MDKPDEYEFVIIRIVASCVHSQAGNIIVVTVDLVVPGGILIIKS
jgi:hypothetical protein